MASGVIYATLAAILSFGLVSLILLKPVSEDFAESGKSSTNLSPPRDAERVQNSVFSWTDISVMLAQLISAALIYVVPTMGTSLIWADWLAIPIQNYTRIVAAVLLTTFLPGYFLLGDFDWRRQLKGLEVALLSCLLSSFAVPLVSVVGSNFGLTPAGFEAPLLLSLNFAALFAFLCVRLVGAAGAPWFPASQIRGARELMHAAVCSVSRRIGVGEPGRLYRNVSLVGILGIELAISYRLFPYPPYLAADQWPHHAAARLYENYGNQVFATGLVPYYAQGPVTYYPQWFHIYLGSLFSVSGAPSVNTYFLINFTNIFGLLALYLLGLALFRKESRAITTVALALALFSGFGWVYDLWLKASGSYLLYSLPYSAGDVLRRLSQTSISTFDVGLANTYFGSAHPDLTAGLHVMALPALLLLLMLTMRSDLNDWTRCTLIGLLMSLAFLGHVAEGGIFAAILLFAVIFWERISSGVWKVALATLAGTGLSGAVGLLLPDGFYLSQGAFYATLACSATALGVGFVRQKLSGGAPPTHRPRMRLAVALSVVTLGIWVALVLLWRLSGYSAYTIWWDCPACASTVPPYIYPVRFGILGLLAIPAIAFLGLVWRDRIRGVALIFGFAATALVLGRLWMIPQLLRITRIEEFRWNKYLALALTLPTAFFVWRGMGRLSVSRRTVNRIIVGFLFSVLLTSGLASTILYAEFTSLSYRTAEIPTPSDLPIVEAGTRFPGFAVLDSHELSPEGLAAIQYLVDHLQSGESVAVMGDLVWGPNSFPYSKVAFMGGLLQNQTFSLTSLYGVTNQTEADRMLLESRVRFVYLSQQDIRTLRAHQAIFDAITALPIVFANSEVTIYALNGQ